jgi:hypothetical protein
MVQDADDRRQALKNVIRALHDGVPAKKLEKDFRKVIKRSSAEEIAGIEQSLIDEGFPVEEVQRLCEVHASVFERAFTRGAKPGKIPGHPIHTYLMENREAGRAAKRFAASAKGLKKGGPAGPGAAAFREALSHLAAIEVHYARKENQLFPALERKGFTAPSRVMWGKHDEIRAALRAAAAALESGDAAGAAEKARALASSVKKMIFLEEKILFPTAARKLSEAEWARMAKGEAEIGYAWVKPAAMWDAGLVRAGAVPVRGGDRAFEAWRAPAEAAPADGAGPGEGEIPLDEGGLTAWQVNAMLKTLPVDVTFVDENDRVLYYSAGSHRVFPRSPNVIGREVRNCHPPKSLKAVEAILKGFRDGTKKEAEFWIRSQGRFLHIRYFPVHGPDGAYRGCIEVTQDATGIRGLEGEKRILDP